MRLSLTARCAVKVMNRLDGSVGIVSDALDRRAHGARGAWLIEPAEGMAAMETLLRRAVGQLAFIKTLAIAAIDQAARGPSLEFYRPSRTSIAAASAETVGDQQPLNCRACCVAECSSRAAAKAAFSRKPAQPLGLFNRRRPRSRRIMAAG